MVGDARGESGAEAGAGDATASDEERSPPGEVSPPRAGGGSVDARRADDGERERHGGVRIDAREMHEHGHGQDAAAGAEQAEA